MKIAELTHEQGVLITTWQYPPPYDLYDNTDLNRESPFELETRNFGVTTDEGELIGYVSYGPECCVHGGDYSVPAVDIGIGLIPELTGRGYGRVVLQQFIDEIVIPGDFPPLLRATIAAFNQRSLKTFLALGFHESQRFTTRFAKSMDEVIDLDWIVVTRPTVP